MGCTRVRMMNGYWKCIQRKSKIGKMCKISGDKREGGAEDRREQRRKVYPKERRCVACHTEHSGSVCQWNRCVCGANILHFRSCSVVGSWRPSSRVASSTDSTPSTSHGVISWICWWHRFRQEHSAVELNISFTIISVNTCPHLYQICGKFNSHDSAT